MSEFTLDSSSLVDANAFKDHIARTETISDTVSANIEEVKRQRANDLLIKAPGLAANEFDIQLRQLSEKTEAAREALHKLKSQTVQQKQFHDQILANIEALKGTARDGYGVIRDQYTLPPHESATCLEKHADAPIRR